MTYKKMLRLIEYSGICPVEQDVTEEKDNLKDTLKGEKKYGTGS